MHANSYFFFSPLVVPLQRARRRQKGPCVMASDGDTKCCLEASSGSAWKISAKESELYIAFPFRNTDSLITALCSHVAEKYIKNLLIDSK